MDVEAKPKEFKKKKRFDNDLPTLPCRTGQGWQKGCRDQQHTTAGWYWRMSGVFPPMFSPPPILLPVRFLRSPKKQEI